MARNYAETTDVEEAGYQGDDTLFKRTENEDELVSTMSGENVIPEKYGSRNEDLPPQMGDENRPRQQQLNSQSYESGNSPNDNQDLQQQSGQRYRDDPLNSDNRPRDGNTQLQDERFNQETEQRDSPGTPH